MGLWIVYQTSEKFPNAHEKEIVLSKFFATHPILPYLRQSTFFFYFFLFKFYVYMQPLGL